MNQQLLEKLRRTTGDLYKNSSAFARDHLVNYSFPLDCGIPTAPLAEFNDKQFIRAVGQGVYENRDVDWPATLRIPLISPQFMALAELTDKDNKEHGRSVWVDKVPGDYHLIFQSSPGGNHSNVQIHFTQPKKQPNALPVGSAHSHPHIVPPGLGVEFFSPTDMKSLLTSSDEIFSVMVCGRRMFLAAKNNFQAITEAQFDDYLANTKYMLAAQFTPGVCLRNLSKHFGVTLYVSDAKETEVLHKVKL